MAVSPQNIKLEPCNVFLGKRHLSTVTFTPDVAGSLNNKYFTTLINGVGYFCWLNINSAGVSPAPVGFTELAEIAGATGATAAALAAAAVSAINAANLGVKASAVGAVLTLTHLQIGVGTVAAGDSGFTIANTIVGEKYDLGGTQGGVTVSPEISTVEVMADQLGAQRLDEIMNGCNVTIAMTLLEVTAAKWAKIVGGFSGSNFTPAGGDEITGFGEFKNFTNMSAYAMELVLEPVGAVDNSRNIHFWKSYPIPSSVNFSGEDLQVMELEFRALRDESKDTKINLFAFGNAAQDLS